MLQQAAAPGGAPTSVGLSRPELDSARVYSRVGLPSGVLDASVIFGMGWSSGGLSRLKSALRAAPAPGWDAATGGCAWRSADFSRLIASRARLGSGVLTGWPAFRCSGCVGHNQHGMVVGRFKPTKVGAPGGPGSRVRCCNRRLRLAERRLQSAYRVQSSTRLGCTHGLACLPVFWMRQSYSAWDGRRAV